MATMTIETVRKLTAADAGLWSATCDDLGQMPGFEHTTAWDAIRGRDVLYERGSLRVRHPEHTAGEWVTIG